MKSSVEQINPVQYRVRVELSAEEVNQAFDGAYRRLQKKARIQGFRPGKAPLGIIKKLYGGNVTSEVHEELVNKHLFSALSEQSIRPIASPVLDSQAIPRANEAFDFTVVVDIMPKLDFKDYKGVAVSAERYTIKDETVSRELERRRRQHALVRPAEEGAVAAKGLLAAVSHTAMIDGQELPAFKVKGMTVQLGEQELFAGLEAAILGMRVGETRDAAVRLPDDYGEPDLAGKEPMFTITLEDLKHLDLPALDDEFAKDLGFEGQAALIEDAKTALANRAQDMARQRLEGAILDQIIDQHPFEVPPAMVDQVIDSMIGELRHPSDEARAAAVRDPELRKQFLDPARRRTQNTLVLWHVTQAEQLQVGEDELKERIDATLKSFGVTDPKQAARLRKNIEARLRENMIFEKAMDFLIQNASITEVPAEL